MGYAPVCHVEQSGNREVHYRARRPPGPNDAFGGSRDLGKSERQVDDGHVMGSQERDRFRLILMAQHEAF